MSEEDDTHKREEEAGTPSEEVLEELPDDGEEADPLMAEETEDEKPWE